MFNGFLKIYMKEAQTRRQFLSSKHFSFIRSERYGGKRNIQTWIFAKIFCLKNRWSAKRKSGGKWEVIKNVWMDGRWAKILHNDTRRWNRGGSYHVWPVSVHYILSPITSKFSNPIMHSFSHQPFTYPDSPFFTFQVPSPRLFFSLLEQNFGINLILSSVSC